MPLRDHFHPPLSQRRHWDSFHGAWAEAIALHLNQSLLPERFYAEARVSLGDRVEIDVATFDDTDSGAGQGGVAVWSPPQATAVAALNFSALDQFEVQVLNDEEGPRVVAAIELVSPANKNRPSHRRMFAVKCASYLQQGISVIVVDVVTARRGNLHAELMKLLRVSAATPGQETGQLYGAAYRTITGADAKLQLEIWAEKLALGDPLPTLPLWIGPNQNLPLDLEKSYGAACAARRIA